MMIQSALVMLGILALGGDPFAPPADGRLSQSSSVETDPETATPNIAIPVPTVTNRLTAGVVAEPNRIQRGERITVFLRVRVAEGCHIYAFEKSKGSAVPTSIKIGLPNSLVPIDDWQGPKPKLERDGTRTFSGSLLFRRRFRVDGRFPEGDAKIPVQFSYQVCNEAVCWPPEMKQLECQLEIVK